MAINTIEWSDGKLRIIDQTLLPGEYCVIELPSTESVWHAIKRLQVRGAPAIGIAAAFGLLVALKEKRPATGAAARAVVNEAADYLATSRPTAVNLFWALDRMRRALDATPKQSSASEIEARLESEAIRILEEDRERCRAIGSHGASLIAPGSGVLTHCNAGGLATADYGTALAVLFTAHENGVPFQVFADETRPLLQGARLTAWELQNAGIDVTLICDNMAAQVMREDKVQLVVVGADRIASNGDTANKIGTYGVAVLAHAHGIPFYVAAPTSTIDTALQSGDEIPIEQRDREEIVRWKDAVTAPEGVAVYNPAFDVTPAKYIAGIITERGILRPQFNESIAAVMKAQQVGSG